MQKFKLILLATAILPILFFACKKPVAPEYGGIEDFRVNSIGLGQSDLSANLKYFNPNAFAMRLSSGEVDVYMNNRLMGKSILDTLTVIPARDSFLIPVSMEVDMKQLFANALDLVLSGNEVMIKLDGFARLGKAGLYFKFPIRYEGRQKIDIQF